MERIAVVGGGSWGTALAHILGTKGYGVDFWVRRKELADEIALERENKVYQPGIKISENINPSTDLELVVHDKKFIILVVPSGCVKKTAQNIAPFLKRDVILVNAAKGFDQENSGLLSQVIAEETGLDYKTNIACLSGPNHAEEIAAAATEARPISDIRASATYRRSLVRVLALRTLLDAVAIARQGAPRP